MDSVPEEERAMDAAEAWWARREEMTWLSRTLLEATGLGRPTDGGGVSSWAHLLTTLTPILGLHHGIRPPRE